MSRIPHNTAERQFYEMMTNEGWTLTKRGWPDFACYKDNRLMLVEIKPKRSRKLKKEQYKLMCALSRLEVECYRWSPDEKMFERIINYKHL